jgi:phosphoribosylanthranilate isomerase
MKPRIKICGLTRLEDLQQAVQAGADAIGLVFYPPSRRYVDLPTAARLARAVPPFVSIVGLFVNADPATVRATLAAVPIHLLQLHGDEDEAYCRQFDRPYIKAARVRPGMDLVQYAAGLPVGAGDPSRCFRGRIRRRGQDVRLVVGASLAGQATGPLRWADCR